METLPEGDVSGPDSGHLAEKVKESSDMKTHVRALVLSVVVTLAAAGVAGAQTQATASSSQGDGWKVTLYPILAWVPLGIGIDVTLPPVDGGPGGGGKIIDGRFDGAFFGGFSVAHRFWRADVGGLWAAFGGDRLQNPKLTVDVDAIYWHGSGGIRLYKGLYATAGVRRYALKYDIKLADYPNFQRKPGVWDPLVGLAWHHVGDKLEVHTTFDAGGFGVGADVDLAADFRLDWKPVRHFGLTGGYQVLYLKASPTLVGRTFTFKQTLHGPMAGIGIYF
jgi:hypothetical protein